MTHFKIDDVGDDYYTKLHLDNIKLYIDLILSEYLVKFDFNNKKHRLIYSSAIDSILINVYWLAEKKNVKDIKSSKNLDNPFYIWCKFFDAEKHPVRQIQIANKILNAVREKVKPALNGSPEIVYIKEFVKNLMCDDEYKHISDETYYNLYIKFIQPIFIDTTDWTRYGINDAHALTKNYAKIFWQNMKEFTNFLSKNLFVSWDNIWSKFENNFNTENLKMVWITYFKLFNLK